MIKDILQIKPLASLAKERIEAIWRSYLDNIPAANLKAALAYALENGGKYLRPQLIYAAGELFDAPIENLDITAAAVELMHTYSLIHDDLPCMDNAPLRRGKPTCHVAFDEGLAVLAGDALQTLSIQIIASHPAPLSNARRLQMITTLTTASGVNGMAAGQALDIACLHRPGLKLAELEEIYRLKTGALFTACLELAWLASPNSHENELKHIRKLGDLIGLAFQIQDDILDIEAATDTLGKPQGLDAENKKNTYPVLTSLPAAKKMADSLFTESMDVLAALDATSSSLCLLIQQILRRTK